MIYNNKQNNPKEANNEDQKFKETGSIDFGGSNVIGYFWSI